MILSTGLVSTVLRLLLLTYFVVHLPLDIYMMVSRDRKRPLRTYGIKPPNQINAITGFFSLLMWVYWFLLAIPSIHDVIRSVTPDYPYWHILQYLQYSGLMLAGLAVLIACWGRIARGKHAASWGLCDSTPLIVSGPFRFIRHPSYLFYILMFLALPLASLILPSLLLILGIWSYHRIARDEERLLLRHFGDKYRRYQERTGRFFPKPKMR